MVIGVVVICIALAEAGFRHFPDGVQDRRPLPVRDTVLQQVSDAFVRKKPGIDPAWFHDLPALPTGKTTEKPRPPGYAPKRPPSNALLARMGSNFPNVYNYEDIRREVCGGEPSFFRDYPFALYAFKPTEPGRYPPFRYFPDAHYVSGLITNAYGWRSPDIELAKPADTVRLAFVGASTTVNHPLIQASYPEFVGHWLNLWSRHNDLRVRFEIINAGRGGRSSSDIEAIVRTEVLPFAPDLIVYYEGSNQFRFDGFVQLPAGESFGRPFNDRLRQATDRTAVWKALTERSALARRVDTVLDRYAVAGDGRENLLEPEKPVYEIRWPEGVDEFAPDPDSTNLPLNLTAVVRDLKSIRRQTHDAGSLFVLSSFVWLAYDGMVLESRRADVAWSALFGGIYGYLNEKNWPIRYRDIRRFADFQNRVFAAFAARYDIPFVDVAVAFPQNPDLFFDGVHMTEEGIRLRSWLTFERLTQILQPLLEAGRVPIAAPPARATEFTRRTWPEEVGVSAVDCRPFLVRNGQSQPVVLDLSNFASAYAKARLSVGAAVEIVTAAEKFAYAAELPFRNDPSPVGVGVVEIEADVAAGGRVSFGVLSKDRKRFLGQTIADAGSKPFHYVIVPGWQDAGSLMVSNAQDQDGIASTVTVSQVRLYLADSDNGLSASPESENR